MDRSDLLTGNQERVRPCGSGHELNPRRCSDPRQTPGFNRSLVALNRPCEVGCAEGAQRLRDPTGLTLDDDAYRSALEPMPAASARPEAARPLGAVATALSPLSR